MCILWFNPKHINICICDGKNRERISIDFSAHTCFHTNRTCSVQVTRCYRKTIGQCQKSMFLWLPPFHSPGAFLGFHLVLLFYFHMKDDLKGQLSEDPMGTGGDHGGPCCYLMWSSTNNQSTACLFSPPALIDEPGLIAVMCQWTLLSSATQLHWQVMGLF